MRGAALPAALLAAATGMVLGHLPAGRARAGAVAFCVVAALIALAPLPPLNDDVLFTGCWLSVLGSAALLHWPGRLLRFPRIADLAVAVNAGVWAGLAPHVGGGPVKLLPALPLILVMVPTRLALRAGWGVAVRVAASWLIAIAGLEALLPLIPTPGYRPDHMD
jgi:hypothetical protein